MDRMLVYESHFEFADEHRRSESVVGRRFFRRSVSFSSGDSAGRCSKFLCASEPHDEILAERRHWLMTDPARYAVLLPEGEAALDATLGQFGELSKNGNLSATSFEKLLTLGCSWEPDFVLLRRDSSDRMVVVGGCVCFPTFWRLTDKLGQPVGIVHDVVPGLNATIGPGIDNFLSRMKPGCWERSNWGMARSPSRNQHPDVHAGSFPADCTIDDVWLRIEDQALVPVAGVAGVVFGIRLRHVALREILQCQAAAERLLTAIETMPADMLRYKNLTAIRERLIGWLRSVAA